MRKAEEVTGERESKSLERTKETKLTKKGRRPRGSRLRNITNRFLETFQTDKPGGLRVFDTETRGFAATAYPGGRIVFGVRFGNRLRRRWITLGELGTEVTLAAARSRAREIVSESVLGGDPVGDRRRANAIPLLRDFLEDYAAWSEKAKKARTLRAEAVYRKVAEKQFGGLRLDEITPAALREVALAYTKAGAALQREPLSFLPFRRLFSGREARAHRDEPGRRRPEERGETAEEGPQRGRAPAALEGARDGAGRRPPGGLRSHGDDRMSEL